MPQYSNLFNVSPSSKQGERSARAAPQFIPVCEEYFGSKPIAILEIGVFKAGFTELFSASRLNIGHYIGIDPYAGSGEDPYLGGYWSDRQSAENVFLEASQKFKDWGYELVRTTSLDYLSHLHPDSMFDLIYIDGDHRFFPALWDMCAAVPHVSSDGLLAIDDYANSDTPEVTAAVTRFVHYHRENVLRIGWVENSFVNGNKVVPIIQRTVFVQLVPIEDRISLDLPEVTPARSKKRSIMSKILDISPRKVINLMRGLQ